MLSGVFSATHPHEVVSTTSWLRPDPSLAAAGVEGEFVVARVRMVAMALLLIAPTWNIIQMPDKPVYVAGFIVALSAGLASVAIWWMLRGGSWRPWVGFVSSAGDVSMVTLALVSFLVVASPMVALNSTVTFEMYFLAIVATSLRYDARICIVTGALALMQFGGLWAYAALRYDLHDPSMLGAAGAYSPVDLTTRLIMMGIATLLSVTIVRRARRLLYLASRDRLTGLYNRGLFDAALTSAMNFATRTGQPLSLALLDIDRFKLINDEHGHAVGDRALRHLARILTASMRRTDIVARYGGEEFVILMPATTRENALTRIEMLRKEVTEKIIELTNGEVLRIDFSAGIAGIPADEAVTTAKELMSAADRRLLAAKRGGRGRCYGADIVEANRPAGVPARVG